MGMNGQQKIILDCVNYLGSLSFPESDYEFLWEGNVLRLYFRNVQDESVQLFVSFVKNEVCHSPIEYKILEENDNFWSKI